MPTIRYLLQKGARARPDVAPRPAQGRARAEVLSLKPVAVRLERLLRQPVALAPTTASAPRPRRLAQALTDGAGAAAREPALPPRGGDERCPRSPRRSRSSASCYVNDAFGTAHRAHASTEGVTSVPEARGGRVPDAEGARVPGQGARPARAAVRRRARRREDLGQDRRHHGAARQGGPAADRRRHDVHVPARRRACATGKLAGRGRSRRDGEATCSPQAARRRRRARAAGGLRRVDGDRRQRARRAATACDALGPDEIGVDIGPETRGAVREQAARRARPWCGTAPWASSRCRRSPRARMGVAQARWPRCAAAAR